jgi:two-component system cell cycle sensor histidine kinase/response regulator CckA
MFRIQLSDIPASLERAALRPRATIEPTRRKTRSVTTEDLICTHDFEGRILSVSTEACEALGKPASAFLGVTIQELLPPGTASGFAAYLQRVTSRGFDVGTINFMTRSGGRTWEYRNTLDRNETSGPFIRMMARDVTEREAAFQDIRHSEEHFRSIIENASDIIAIVELNGRIRYESPSIERVLGYPPNDLVGKHFIDLIHPDDAGRAADFLVRQVADPDVIQTIELRTSHHGGTWRSFEIVAKNLVKDGEASAIVMNARDITERKLLQAQLVQANRLAGLGRLAATVAHEFNNVLMGMQPFAELMQRADATPPMISRGAGHIANSIQRGKRIVLDILRFTQPYLPITAAVDLGEWWDAFAPEAEGVLGNSIAVVSTIPRHRFFVIADRGQLTQVVINLVANARDAMSGGGTLTVAANHLEPDATFPFGVVPRSDRFVQISIGDTGRGMTPEVMERIFEPLYTTRLSGGTGLGLAVAHQILTQHAGYIFVESEPARGTTFHLFLPLAAAPSSAVTRNLHTRKPAARRLLMIEDEESIIEGVTTLMALHGIEVEGIARGADAADAMGRFHPDVVLLDYSLPDMDGAAVYAAIRELDRGLPVIFASGHGDRRTENGIEDPKTGFLQKPFEVVALLEMMVDLESGGAR